MSHKCPKLTKGTITETEAQMIRAARVAEMARKLADLGYEVHEPDEAYRRLTET
jgi:dsRNA-specific ribonuclease